jgi:hypothetical protein
MPIIYRDDYGRRLRPDGKPGWIYISPTRDAYYEADGTDVRLDRMSIFGPKGGFEGSVLLDKMGAPFRDNLPGTEDDFGYLRKLPSRERI